MKIFGGILLGLTLGRIANGYGGEWQIGIGFALVALTIFAWVIERKRKHV